MGSYYYRVKHTAANDTVKDEFIYQVPQKLTDRWSRTSEMAMSYPAWGFNCATYGADNITGYTIWLAADVNTKNSALACGYANVRVVSDYLAVGDKFVFDDTHYIQIAAISGTSNISITWAFYVGGTNTTTISYDGIETVSSNMLVSVNPVLPYISDNIAGGSFVNKIHKKLVTNLVSGQYDTALTNIYSPTNAQITNIKAFYSLIEPLDMSDPYIDIPDSVPSGPADATGIPESDPIDFPSLPTVSVSDTGFVTLFNPTLSQVKDLADYMWTGLFDVNTIRKLFADPMDCILGFNMLPVAIPHGSSVAVCVGNIPTGVGMNAATSQWVEVDCGTLAIGDAFGNYLSYAPYTKFSMYLPYIGIVELSTDDVVGKTLALKYHVDVLSCGCVAYLKCGDSVLYQFTGSCGYSIPVSSNDFRATIANIVSITATVAGAVVTGGAAAGVTAGTTAKAAAKAARMKAARTAAAIGDAASIGKNVMGSKPEVHRSGAIGGSAGILGMQKPFLIVEYPNPCKPKKQYHYTGYPSYVTVKLNDISGYAEFEQVLVEGVPCTEAEQTMIKELCEGGIFL